LRKGVFEPLKSLKNGQKYKKYPNHYFLLKAKPNAKFAPLQGIALSRANQLLNQAIQSVQVAQVAKKVEE
jgi:hypothetical protein